MMRNTVPTGDLFAAPPLPAGLEYHADFVTRDEEAAVIEAIEKLPLREAEYRQYTARRRVARFGHNGYPACGDSSEDADVLPAWLDDVRDRAAALADVDKDAFVHALVTEYRPGTPIGWHRDSPEYGTVVGISLASACSMRFRPYDDRKNRAATIALDLAPRSAYVLRGDIRWRWQHHIPPVASLRYSITFRTLAWPRRTRFDNEAAPAS
ncbi:MAG TPA: alpha-ketoglutarate-dependent dioxygenase AlkB [Casimicrobiaceae bacterium]|nr:alpha-ketoglutarate-dependent dioxygenase AlkB [Casimicrobiaceae bacterium]